MGEFRRHRSLETVLMETQADLLAARRERDHYRDELEEKTRQLSAVRIDRDRKNRAVANLQVEKEIVQAAWEETKEALAQCEVELAAIARELGLPPVDITVVN